MDMKCSRKNIIHPFAGPRASNRIRRFDHPHKVRSTHRLVSEETFHNVGHSHTNHYPSSFISTRCKWMAVFSKEQHPVEGHVSNSNPKIRSSTWRLKHTPASFRRNESLCISHSFEMNCHRLSFRSLAKCMARFPKELRPLIADHVTHKSEDSISDTKLEIRTGSSPKKHSSMHFAPVWNEPHRYLISVPCKIMAVSEETRLVLRTMSPVNPKIRPVTPSWKYAPARLRRNMPTCISHPFEMNRYRSVISVPCKIMTVPEETRPILRTMSLSESEDSTNDTALEILADSSPKKHADLYFASVWNERCRSFQPFLQTKMHSRKNTESSTSGMASMGSENPIIDTKDWNTRSIGFRKNILRCISHTFEMSHHHLSFQPIAK